MRRDKGDSGNLEITTSGITAITQTKLLICFAVVDKKCF